jgi:hypothetical protein
MSAGRYSFVIEQGATLDLEIVYKDASGTPVNLSGYTAAMQIRNTQGGSTLYATLTSSLGNVYNKKSGSAFLSLSGSTLAKPLASGSIGVYIGHTVTNGFTFNEGYYDLELTNGQTRVRLLEGKVQVLKQVTTV